MTDTPRGAPELVSGQAIPETTVNEQVRHTEAGAGHFIVADNDLTAPPGACADGVSFIVAAVATGLWAGKENYVATAMGANAVNGWTYHAPKEGYTAYIQDENARHLCDGAAWALDTTGGSYTSENARDDIGAALAAGNGIDLVVNDGADTITIDVDVSELEPTDSEMWTGISQDKAVTPNKLLDAAVPQALADGATVTPDFNAGFNFEWTIGGNRTLANPTNAKSGQSGTIRITQDATGTRVVTYGNNWRFPGGSATGGVLSTAANAVDLIAFTVGTDGKIYATLSKAFAA